MDKIKINLLPPEIKDKAKKEAKQALINKISVALLGVLILITSSVLAVVIFQAATVNFLNSDIQKEKSRIEGFKEAEVVVTLLKNRIGTINQFSTQRYTQSEVFDLITGLISPGIDFDSFEIGKSSKIAIRGKTDTTSALQTFFNGLTDPKTNEGKITSVTVESLNKNQVGKINFELTVQLADGVIK